MVRCDEEAWTEFHQRYFDWLHTTSLLRGSSHSDADDIVQQTCLRAVRHIKVFDSENELKNWLSCLMRCVVIDRARKLDRRHILIEKFTLWQQLKQDDQNHQDDLNLDHLDRAMSELACHDAQLIKLKYIDGWSTHELAEKNSTTPKAIESKLARLRKKIRLQINQSTITEQ